MKNLVRPNIKLIYAIKVKTMIPITNAIDIYNKRSFKKCEDLDIKRDFDPSPFIYIPGVFFHYVQHRPINSVPKLTNEVATGCQVFKGKDFYKLATKQFTMKVGRDEVDISLLKIMCFCPPIPLKNFEAALKKVRTIRRGEFVSKQKNRFAALLRKNNIRVRDLLSLKMFLDFDIFHSQVCSCFHQDSLLSNSALNEKEVILFSQFGSRLLKSMRKIYDVMNKNKLKIQPLLFMGIAQPIKMVKNSTLNFNSVLDSMTRHIHVARSWAGKGGMIIAFKPVGERTPLDVSWLSDYPDEMEFLNFGNKLKTVTWISSENYDKFYFHMHNIFTNYQKQVASFFLQQNSVHDKGMIKAVLNGKDFFVEKSKYIDRFFYNFWNKENTHYEDIAYCKEPPLLPTCVRDIISIFLGTKFSQNIFKDYSNKKKDLAKHSYKKLTASHSQYINRFIDFYCISGNLKPYPKNIQKIVNKYLGGRDIFYVPKNAFPAFMGKLTSSHNT